MTKKENKTKGMEGCCEGIDFTNCCEQMSEMMAQFQGTGKKGFDCSAMMQKMRCAPKQQNEQQ